MGNGYDRKLDKQAVELLIQSIETTQGRLQITAEDENDFCRLRMNLYTAKHHLSKTSAVYRNIRIRTCTKSLTIDLIRFRPKSLQVKEIDDAGIIVDKKTMTKISRLKEISKWVHEKKEREEIEFLLYPLGQNEIILLNKYFGAKPRPKPKPINIIDNLLD